MKIALGQFEVTQEKAPNLKRMLTMVEQASASGAELVLFPEVAMSNVDENANASDFAEPITGPFVSQLAKAAQTHKIAIVLGVLETIAASKKAYNSVVAIGSDGEIIGTYRKIHMFDAFGYQESKQNEPGNGDTLIFSVAGVKFGVAICYDVRFPELFRHLATNGADVILLPAAWAAGLQKEHQWNTLVTARAIENTVYMVATDQVGGSNCGGSMLVDPMGVTVVSLGEAEGLLFGDVDLDRIAAVRKKLPSLQHIRPEIYRRWELVAGKSR